MMKYVLSQDGLDRVTLPSHPWQAGWAGARGSAGGPGHQQLPASPAPLSPVSAGQAQL